jgi:hypothetical protein
LLESYEKMPVAAPPSNVEAWLKNGNLQAFFSWLNEQEIDDSIRIRDEIPEKAPWSKWEKSIIAFSWINRFISDSCRLFWKLVINPLQYNFANELIILSPVIEIKRKNDLFFYEIAQTYEPNLTSLSLIGETLYSPLEGRLDKRVIPPRGATSNRLSVIWNINMAEDNTITGSVNIIIRNSWKDFLLSEKNEIDVLREIAGKAAMENDIKTKKVKDGIEISAQLRPSKTILGTKGTNAIIPLNPPKPDWLRDIAMGITPYSIKFPLVIEMNYKINLPSKVVDILPPTPIDRDGGKIKYMEKYEYFRRSKRLEATFRITISNVRIEENMEQDIAFAIGRFGSQRTIPLRMK